MDRTTGGAPTRPPQGVAGAVLLLGVLLAGAAPLIPLAVLVYRYEPELLPLFAVPLAVLVAAWRIARDRARDQLTDPLTDLPNRQALLMAAQEAIAERADGYSVGLILLDLDRFRSLNDTLGHTAGDRLLVHIARRLHRALRSGGPAGSATRESIDDVFAGLPRHYRRGRPMVARMGGDEFAVLLPGINCPDSLERVAKALIAELAAPIRLDGLLLVLEASAGVCVYPQHAQDAESLLRRADVAMGHAQRGCSGVAQYDETQDADTPYRIGLLGDLRRALETGEVQLHYQPKVAFDGRVVGLEALLRWERPGQGRVSPDEFVGLAESSGLMPRLTDYVLEAAVGQLASWRDQGLQVQVAVNVSPRDVLNPGFAQRVAGHLVRHQVPAHALQLEITERLLLDDSRRAADTLAELRGYGVGMSLDDFGTGHSSLVRLRSLPVGELKIDRSFVSRMVADDHDAAVVRCSVELAHSLGLTVVAEGVEDDETWERLHCMGVDAVQGWLVSAALPAEQATAWLRVHRTGAPPVERLAASRGQLPAALRAMQGGQPVLPPVVQPVIPPVLPPAVQAVQAGPVPQPVPAAQLEIQAPGTQSWARTRPQ
ncbi:putative signal transduction protein with EAL and GGDEF domain [Kitasatospora sp. MAA19]|uniref:putative bifunctional diguanylate cyclase/phosphodiesterase n=1 Tax=Kitasatospora sp. MAA19 TaxID=3035090 RepID=UPI00247591FF|nr:bifunctional diguanylate cyclase/phosphodiesterase [Kitasatospora sp. MAA19]MDH6704927.1 putative signal transduction protein with EAL and GGDEF domain [Kitasatospora sp. MAA19]